MSINPVSQQTTVQPTSTGREAGSNSDALNNRKTAAITRLGEINQMGENRQNSFDLVGAVTTFNLDVILRDFSENYASDRLLELADWAGNWAGIGSPKREGLSNAIERYRQGHSDGDQERQVRIIFSKIYSYFNQKKNQCRMAQENTDDLKANYLEIVDKIINANRNCVDQMLSQLQDIMLDIAVEAYVPREGNRQLGKILCRAGHALCVYKINLLRQILYRQNPNEGELVDLERVVMQRLAGILGLEGAAFTSGARYEGMLRNVDNRILDAIDAFWQEYRPLEHLAAQMATGNGTMNKLRNELLMWVIEHYGIDAEDSDAVTGTDLNPLLSANFNPNSVIDNFSDGGVWTPGAIFLILEAAGLIQHDTHSSELPRVQEQQISNAQRARQVVEEWAAMQRNAQRAQTNPPVQPNLECPLPSQPNPLVEPFQSHPVPNVREPVSFFYRLEQGVTQLAQQIARAFESQPTQPVVQPEPETTGFFSQLFQQIAQAISQQDQLPTVTTDDTPVGQALRQLISDRAFLNAANVLVQAVAARGLTAGEGAAWIRNINNANEEDEQLALRMNADARTAEFYESFMRQIIALGVDMNSVNFVIYAAAAQALIQDLGMNHARGPTTMASVTMPNRIQTTLQEFNRRIFESIVNSFAAQPLESITIESLKRKIAGLKMAFAQLDTVDIESMLRQAIKAHHDTVAIEHLRGEYANPSPDSARLQEVVDSITAALQAEREALTAELNAMRGPNGFDGTVNAAYQRLNTAEAQKNDARTAYFVQAGQLVPQNGLHEGLFALLSEPTNSSMAIESARQLYIQRMQEFNRAELALNLIRARFSDIAVYTGPDITGGRLFELNQLLRERGRGSIINEGRNQAVRIAGFYAELNHMVTEQNKVVRSRALNAFFA